MPLLQSLGNGSALAWGRIKRVLKLNWVIRGTGAGYGIKVTSKTGNLYYQNYATTRKLNKNGEFIWGRALGAGNIEALSADSAENVYIAGAAGFLVAKYDTNGSIQWQRTYATGTSDNAQDMVSNTIGTSYVVGAKVGVAEYGAILCIDSSGNTVWSQYNTTLGTGFLGVGYNASVGLVAAVGTKITGSVRTTIVAVFNAGNGTLQWQREISASDGNHFGMGCVLDSVGNVYVSGMAFGTRKSYLIKYNSSGTFQWARQLEVPGMYSYNDYATPGVDSNDNVYISFYQDANNADFPNEGGGFAKFNSSGTLQFVRKINTVTGWLRINVAPDGTVGIMGVSGVAKLNGDGTGLGTYPGFTYASSSLVATTPSFTYSTSSYSYTSAGYTGVASSYSVTSSSLSPNVEYIGTEVG